MIKYEWQQMEISTTSHPLSQCYSMQDKLPNAGLFILEESHSLFWTRQQLTTAHEAFRGHHQGYQL